MAREAATRDTSHQWLQDIYPEVATQLGVTFIKGPVSTLLSSTRNASLRNANVNVVVGDRMSENISHLGVPPDRISVVPNWCDDEAIVPLERESNPLRAQWHLQDKFVVGYSGNLGRAHEFETVLAASERLRNNPDVSFLFIGGGHQSAELARRAETQGLKDKFRFFPYQSDQILKYSLSVPDVHWVSLRRELEGLIVPSKIYGIAAAGRPIIAVTAKDGEIANLVRTFDCGVVVEPGNADEMAAAIVRLYSSDIARTEMGRKARAMLSAQFTRRQAFERWSRIVDRVLSDSLTSDLPAP